MYICRDFLCFVKRLLLISDGKIIKEHMGESKVDIIFCLLNLIHLCGFLVLHFLEKLFQIGENVIRSGTANEEGTGLGLVLCMEFAEKNNGSIKVNSRPGKGSTFSVLLPRQLKQE